jgi:hypothetical protein
MMTIGRDHWRQHMAKVLYRDDDVKLGNNFKFIVQFCEYANIFIEVNIDREFLR